MSVRIDAIDSSVGINGIDEILPYQDAVGSGRRVWYPWHLFLHSLDRHLITGVYSNDGKHYPHCKIANKCNHLFEYSKQIAIH